MVQQSTRARWQAIVAEQESSGETIQAFAEARGLNPRTLGWWRWNLRREQGPGEELSFTELAVEGAEDEPTVVVALDDFSAHIVVDEQTDLELLRRMLEALS